MIQYYNILAFTVLINNKIAKINYKIFLRLMTMNVKVFELKL